MPRYTGAPGATRTEAVHVTCACGAVFSARVHRAIDASTDPELAQRLIGDDPRRAINLARCPRDEQLTPVQVSLVYHAPEHRLFVLVIPESQRHLELAERARLWAALAEDRSVVVPEYVLGFKIAWGPAGLRGLLELEAERALATSRAADEEHAQARRGTQLEDLERELAAREAELARITAELDLRAAELGAAQLSIDDRQAALDRRSAELERMSADLNRRVAEPAAPAARPAAPARAPSSPPVEAAPPTAAGTAPFERVEPEEISSVDEEMEVEPEPVDEGEVLVADQVVEEKAAPRRRAAVTEGGTHVGGGADVAIERWIASREEMLKVVDEDSKVRLALSQDGTRLEHLLGDKLALKLQLHRLRAYPLVTLSVGPPEALRGERGAPPAHVFFFDIADPGDRAVLDRLAREFAFSLEIYDGEYLPVRKRQVSASLGENVAYVMAAADEQLAAMDERSRSFAKALIAYDAPDYDRFGLHHPEHREFREDKLTALDTPTEVRRALAIARRFSAPEREAYLVLVRGYPLPQWHSRRRAVLARAVDLGLWVGPTLAQVAVSEGLARSRKDLIDRLRKAFSALCAVGTPELDDGAIADNWAALDEQATQAGLPARGRNGDEAAMVSGTISGSVVARNAAAAAATVGRSPDELIALLENKDRRLESAVELARRGDERAIGPVFNTLRRMTRAEAVRVLGHTVGFGPRAAPHLIDGLRSRKAFLRHGCALALAVLGTEEGIEAICDLLITEPTEIWNELARAVGEVGTRAVMPLMARLAGQSEECRERLAWALAHVAARGGQQAVSTMVNGRDAAAAAVAARALELTATARDDSAQVRGATVDREMTVNRAFSRRFFEALESVRPGSSPDLRDSVDLSGPAMLLDEADLLEAADEADLDAEPLDENDLIPT